VTVPVRIETTRFGALEVPQDRIILFPQGLLGFPGLTRYVLLEHRDTPLCWLQAVDDPAVAFIVAQPAFLGGWEAGAAVREACAALGSPPEGDPVILVILRVEDGKVTANVHGPLVIDAARRVGAQVVLDTA